MKKYFALFALLLVIGQFFYSNHVSNFDLKHDNPIYIQEFELVNASPSEDSNPSYGDGNQTILNTVFLGLVLTITIIFYHSIQIIKRLIQLYPVFYQGNYLIPTSLKIII